MKRNEAGLFCTQMDAAVSPVVLWLCARQRFCFLSERRGEKLVGWLRIYATGGRGKLFYRSIAAHETVEPQCGKNIFIRTYYIYRIYSKSLGGPPDGRRSSRQRGKEVFINTRVFFLRSDCSRKIKAILTHA